MKETSMNKLRQLLQRLRANESKREISTALGMHRRIVRKMHEIASEKEWLNPNIAMPSNEEIDKLWSKDEVKKENHILDPHKEKIQKWHESDVTAVVIQRLIQELYTTTVDVQVVRRYILKNFPKPIKPVMVRNTIPGHDADVDYGDIGVFEDDEGKHRKVYLFSLRLRHSRKAYREFSYNQKSFSFNEAHLAAFDLFEGVPYQVHSDGTKCAITQYTLENDKPNRSYQSLAEHCNFLISPCRPYTPEHKGGVEKDMDYVKRSFIAYFRAQQRELGIEVPKIRDLRNAYCKWYTEVDSVHKIQGVGRTPNEIFYSEEKALLKPRPKIRWEAVIWTQATVRRDWRVMWDNGFYSIPYHLIGKQIDICATAKTVRILHEHQEVAFHERCTKSYEYKRKTEHAPPFQEAVLQCTREGLLSLAKEIGSSVYEYTQKILSTPGLDKLSPVRNMLRLRETYGNENLEKACKRACHFKLNSYREVKNILANKLETEPLEATPKAKKTQDTTQSKKNKFLRDPKEYKNLSWDELLERAYPVAKYCRGILGVQCSMQYDQMMDELIKEEDQAVAEGRVGPLNGVKPKISEAWYRYHGIPIPKEEKNTKSEES